MRSVLYFRGVNSQRRTWSASKTLLSSRYSRYFCCSSKNFILWHDRKQQVRLGERADWNFKHISLTLNKRYIQHSTLSFRKKTAWFHDGETCSTIFQQISKLTILIIYLEKANQRFILENIKLSSQISSDFHYGAVMSNNKLSNFVWELFNHT